MLRQHCWAGLLPTRTRMSAAGPVRAAAQSSGADAGAGGLPKESVWDYPRPPALQPVPQRLRVLLDSGQVVADTSSGFRVCKTASPPTYYFPPDSIDQALLRRSQGGATFCEWKGTASYWNVLLPGEHGGVLERAAWSYESPTPAFRPIAGWLAFYARPPLECWVGEERVQPQEGQYYGGWVTPNITGPFKGGPGSARW